jgi:hypothetical protein
MKKARGLRRAVARVARAELEALPTKALIARLTRLRWCEDGPDRSDMSEQEIASGSELILFKSDPAWHTAYADLRNILASREHVVRAD